MHYSPDPINDQQDRLLTFQQNVASKFAALESEGLATNQDRMKLESEMREAASALQESLQNTTYNENFKQEWLWRIELSYRDRICKRLSDIDSRRHSDRAVSGRINAVVQLTMAALAAIESPRQRIALEAEANKLIKGLQRDIRGISRNHSRRSQLLETWLQEFEQNMRALVSDDSAPGPVQAPGQ